MFIVHIYGLLVDKASTQETSVYRENYTQEMFSSVLVNYVPDTETGDSEDYFLKVERSFSPSLSEAGAERRKVRFWWQRKALYCC